MRIALSRPDLATLGARWRALEARADTSIFQSWTWVGCQVETRFDDPLLLHGTDNGQTVALALFNRRRRALWLHETGNPALDAPFIERNGILVAPGHDLELPALVQALPSGLVLSGVDAALARVARNGRAVVAVQSRTAPVLDLTKPVLETVSANTRAQLRRAIRRHESWGPMSISRAEDPASARDMLAELIALHAARWQGRGSPGAFADPRTVGFHGALIDRGVGRGEVDLLRITAGNGVIGLLYNLRLGGRVFAYQGGFDFAATAGKPSAAQLKPGLVCHAMAADWYRARGAASYDFGGGDAQYKRSLATQLDEMHWLTLAPRWSPRAGIAALRRRLIQFGPGPSSA